MKNLLTLPVFINAAIFQILWFACVLGGAKNLLWPSVLMGIVMVVWQLHPNNRHENDFAMVIAAIILGLVVDTSWTIFGLMEFKDPRPMAPFAPGWILIMWIGFALTVNHSLAWLSNHRLLPPLFGFVGGPLAYYAGLKLGAVEYLANFWLVSLLLGIVWSISLTILVKIGTVGMPTASSRTTSTLSPQ